MGESQARDILRIEDISGVNPEKYDMELVNEVGVHLRFSSPPPLCSDPPSPPTHTHPTHTTPDSFAI